MMIEREEQRSKEYSENTTVSFAIPNARDPVLQDNLLIANIEQVKTLQASLFPICNKGKDSQNGSRFFSDFQRLGKTFCQKKVWMYLANS